MEKSSVKFMSVAQFKATVNSNSLNIFRSPKTGKLVMSTDSGDYFKVQQDIDPALPLAILVEDGDIQGCCLVNVKNVDNTVFTL